MSRSPNPQENGDFKAWLLDQLTKSQFFHEKLHEWGLLKVATAIEQVRGENLEWNLGELGISDQAWRKVIHRGIKPVIVFAHPAVLGTVQGAVGYYRMLAMVSQKSMNRVGLPVARYEAGGAAPPHATAFAAAHHLNQIISSLVEADENINPRELDLWRGMAAGSQAQGPWQNTKGSRPEVLVKGMLQRRLRERRLVAREEREGARMYLTDGREVVFGAEPDVAMYAYSNIQVALEIKGGIDTAGVLERIGAAIKSLRRAKEENPQSLTILIVAGVSMTARARQDLELNRNAVNQWFTVEGFLEDEAIREQVFALLGV